MSFLGEIYVTNELPQSENKFEPLPAGWYSVNIVNAELKTTKAGNGQYIKLKYDVIGPTHHGRVVFGNLNIMNPNIDAEKIGRQQLGEILRALGLSKVKDTDELIGGNLEIKLTIKNNAQYGESNEVKGFKAINGSVATPTPAVKSAPWSKTAATIDPLSNSLPPWAKPKTKMAGENDDIPF